MSTFYQTRKGDAVNSTLTTEQAKDICRQANSGFAKSIASAPNPTDEQVAWMHVIAMKTVTPQRQSVQTTIHIGDCSGINQLFETAKQHLKNPRITLAFAGNTVRLAPAKKAEYAGTIYIDNGGSWDERVNYGRITSQGGFVPSASCPAGLDAYLRVFAANPAQEAAKHGRLTGNCCFCSRGLTDERSTDVGYGPICADHYDLPWGNRPADDGNQAEFDLFNAEVADSLR